MTKVERFWSKVTVTPGCWEWQRGTTNGGYGCVQIRGVGKLAHRISYVLAFGPITPGAWVLHKCDNRRCVNPDHLYVGDNADNVADRVARGRTVAPRGTAHPRSKLTDEVVLDIRARCASGETPARIAAGLGVSSALVSMVRRRAIWKHVGGPSSTRRPVIEPGQRYGSLVVVASGTPVVYPGRSSTSPRWLVMCDCGKTVEVLATGLRSGNSKTCGCSRLRRRKVAS